MKLTLTIERNDYSCSHDLQIDDKHVHIGDLSECPEDAIIGRDLIDGHDILRYIQMGYDAAKRDEMLEITIKEIKE